MAWTAQFIALLRDGVAYPRWLPDAFGGLGSPSFVFYAPLPFYLAGLLDVLTLGLLDPRRIVGLACAAMLLGSGLAMRHWLRRRAGPAVATVCGVLYMVAPYHLYDAFVRGSVGELAAYAILPLLAGALDDVLDGRPRGTARFAGTCALLLLSHLPSALLVGVFYVPARIAFALWRESRTPIAAARMLARTVGAGLLGCAIAAIYVLPALGLLGIAGMDYVHEGQYDLRRWLLLAPGLWPDILVYAFVLSVSLALLWLAVAALALRGQAASRDAAFWPVLIIVIVVAISGLVPWIWLPGSPLARIEFPWRILLMGDFLAVTALAEALRTWRKRQVAVTCAVSAIIAAPAILLLYGLTVLNYRVLLVNAEWQAIEARLLDLKPDAIEYLPLGHPVGFDGRLGPSWDAVFAISEAARDRGTAWLEPDDGRVSTSPDGLRGALAMSVEANAPARVVLRRFYYPFWRLETEHGGAGPALEPYGADRLLSFTAPAGTMRLRLVWAPPSIMVVSMWISGLAIAVLLVIAVQPGRRAAAPPRARA